MTSVPSWSILTPLAPGARRLSLVVSRAAEPRLLFLLALLWVNMAIPRALHGQSPDSASVVRGQVLGYENGDPLDGAAVSLTSGPGGTRGIGTRITDEDGLFQFQQVPPGTYRIRVTLLGFADLQDTLRVDPLSDLDLVLSLSVSPVKLEPLVVVSERRTLGPMGDLDRRRRAFSGTFFDREDIEAMAPFVFTDLLRRVPGVRVLPVDPYRYTVQFRGGCSPVLWVDGVKLITPEGMDDILPPMDLEAVEVYKGPSVPVQFAGNGCGSIVVWTRRGDATGGSPFTWRKFALAAGFLTLAWVLVH